MFIISCEVSHFINGRDHNHGASASYLPSVKIVRLSKTISDLGFEYVQGVKKTQGPAGVRDESRLGREIGIKRQRC